MNRGDQFDRVLAALHAAALDDARWPAAAALLDEACGMRGSALVVGRGRSQADGEIFWTRFCYRGKRYPDREQWYFDHYYAQDERVPRLAALPDSCLAHMRDLYSPAELRSSAAYNEALRRCGYQNGLNVRLDGPDGTSIVWTLADSTEAEGWSSAQVARVKWLLPHLRQFVRVRQSLAAAGTLSATLDELLDQRRIGVIRLDRRGRITEVNDHARTVLRQGDGLFDRDGFLCARVPADHDRLQALLACAFPAAGGAAAGGSLAVGRAGRRPSLAVHLQPVGDRQFDVAAALVLVVDPERGPLLDPGLVAATLGLTPAESWVAAALAQGHSVRDIAMATARQDDSVRYLLKQAYRKLGIASQAELVRLVLRLDGM